MAFLLFRKGYVLPKHEKALIDKAQKRAKHLQTFHDEFAEKIRTLDRFIREERRDTADFFRRFKDFKLTIHRGDQTRVWAEAKELHDELQDIKTLFEGIAKVEKKEAKVAKKAVKETKKAEKEQSTLAKIAEKDKVLVGVDLAHLKESCRASFRELRDCEMTYNIIVESVRDIMKAVWRIFPQVNQLLALLKKAQKGETGPFRIEGALGYQLGSQIERDIQIIENKLLTDMRVVQKSLVTIEEGVHHFNRYLVEELKVVSAARGRARKKAFA